ncbi:EH signature domain-containing protein, partial [Serratia marcescens]|uniref:EH signature domain-containing protein n=1 Tax=Serratia marcescens TaxID=615 RepID=UPI003F683B8B
MFGANTQYARLHSSKRKRIERGHAVLLLKIGNGIVAEWSQNGICNIWHDAHDDTAPKWRRQDYTADEVRLID